MMFVFAASVVAMAALVLTLWKMFPLDRPQVFFLTTEVRPDMDVRLYSMPLRSDAQSETNYKISFIKEYIKARNEISTGRDEMQKKWGTREDGVISMWSSPNVYNDFSNTLMRNLIMQADAEIDMSCNVEFPQGAVTERTADKMTYNVRFNYVCVNNNGQTSTKDYTVIIGLEKEEEPKIKWGERLNNPLGMRIVRYDIDSGNGDPLDFK